MIVFCGLFILLYDLHQHNLIKKFRQSIISLLYADSHYLSIQDSKSIFESTLNIYQCFGCSILSSHSNLEIGPHQFNGMKIREVGWWPHYSMSCVLSYTDNHRLDMVANIDFYPSPDYSFQIILFNLQALNWEIFNQFLLLSTFFQGILRHNLVIFALSITITDLVQPKMSPMLSFSGIYRKPYIYHRNRTNSQ